jgi:demethylmenaquinone methyltransferase/2-methoxy-6-polyprenyl-1,4-benzoquinol methylase
MGTMPGIGDRIARVSRSKQAARAAYDRMSRWYDRMTVRSEAGLTDLGLEMLDARAGERVLEIGPGTGRALESLAKAVGSTGKVFGLDLSPGMLEVAGARLQAGGLAGRVGFSCGDAVRPGFASGACDAIFMSFVLDLIDTPEIPLVLGECHRTLRAGGRIAVVSLAKRPGTAVRVYEWFHARLPSFVDCRPICAGASLERAGFSILGGTEARLWGLPVGIVLARKNKSRPDGMRFPGGDAIMIPSRCRNEERMPSWPR